MAILYMDSFDHYDANGGLAKGWTRSFSLAGVGNGRFGTNGWNGAQGYNVKLLPTNYATLIFGVAYRYLARNDAYKYILCVQDGLDSAQAEMGYLVDTQQFWVSRAGTDLGSRYYMPLTYGQWYYLEWKITINNTTGVTQLRVDGATVINLTSQDTQNTANAYANRFVIGTNSGSAYCSGDLDDLYVLDTSGSAPTNDFLGDVRVQALLPNNNGNSSVLVGSDGNSVNNYQLVDENPQNDDTDYVESSTVGDKDTYAYADLSSASGTVYGVQVLPYARKTDAGSRSIVSVARLSTTEVDSSAKTLGGSYAYLPDIRETKPGGGAWTITDVNNAEFGVKVNT